MMRDSAGAASSLPVRSRISRLAGRSGLIGLLALLLLWMVFLRPNSLGGPAMYVIATGGSMEPAIHAGDLVVGFSQPSYAIGDVVVYRLPASSGYEGRLVVHRIIAGDSATGYTLQGDASANQDPWLISTGDIVGRVETLVAAGGRVLLILRNPLLLASLAAGMVFAFLVIPAVPRQPPRDPAGQAASRGLA